MTQLKKVRPDEGRSVRIPETGQLLPAEGAWVDMTRYWVRRVNTGDVVVIGVEGSKSPSPKTKHKSPSKGE